MKSTPVIKPRRAYRAPELALLGSLVGATAGPDAGEHDALVGSSGGFRPPALLDPS